LEAKALFEHFLATKPTEVSGQALRSFYRRVSGWKRAYGPPKEVFFPQVKVAGESMQLDWTHAEDLGVTLGRGAFPHLLCHAVLPYSNWQWAVPCRSESILSLKLGLQAAVWAMGGVPQALQTDRSSTATHQLKRGSAARGFNLEYLAMRIFDRVGLRNAFQVRPSYARALDFGLRTSRSGTWQHLQIISPWRVA
jgi:hypothetical protein